MLCRPIRGVEVKGTADEEKLPGDEVNCQVSQEHQGSIFELFGSQEIIHIKFN